MFEYIKRLVILTCLYPFIDPLLAHQKKIIKQSKEEFAGLSITLFNFYNEIVYAWNTNYKYYYNNSELFQETSDTITYLYTHIHAFMYNYKIEPDDVLWYNISVLNNRINMINKSIEYTIDEKYEIYDNYNETVQETTMIEYNNLINNMNKNNFISILITIKQDDKYFIQVNNCTHLNLNLKPSKVRFLSIEYEDPLLKEKFVITIDENMLYDKNEILSSAFIKRYLDYNSLDVVYSHNYKIHIMDNNINMVTLTEKDYILLHKENYEIITNN
tara:strand:+ start:1823 stop:2641 length:819 start_codon:yes stop_codon:yes gene_type:complete